MMQQQREEYGRRGIHLTYFEKGTSKGHFINLDEDPFRSHRFMYLLDKVRRRVGQALRCEGWFLSATTARGSVGITPGVVRPKQEQRVPGVVSISHESRKKKTRKSRCAFCASAQKVFFVF